MGYVKDKEEFVVNIESLSTKSERVISFLANFSRRIAAGFLLGMMLLITCDVILRFVFNKPISGSFELVEVMMGTVASLSIAFCGFRRGHVAVELFTDQLPKKIGNILSIFHHVVCVIFFVAIAVKGAQQANITMESGTVTALLEIPIYPFIWILCFGASLLALVYIVQMIEIFKKVVSK